jgi:hypothetical protein
MKLLWYRRRDSFGIGEGSPYRPFLYQPWNTTKNLEGSLHCAFTYASIIDVCLHHSLFLSMTTHPYLASEHVIMFALLLHFAFHLLHACFVFFCDFCFNVLVMILARWFLCVFALLHSSFCFHISSSFDVYDLCSLCFSFQCVCWIFYCKGFYIFLHSHQQLFFYKCDDLKKCDNLCCCCVATLVEVICITGL